MAKVFLIAQPTISREGGFPKLEGLAEFGEVHALIPAGASPSFRPNKTLDSILQQLALLYKPDRDFIVWAGGDTLAALLTGIALERHQHKSMTWLRYDRPYDKEKGERLAEGRYVPVVIQLSNEETQEKAS